MFNHSSIDSLLATGNVGFTGSRRGNALLVSLGRHLLEFAAFPAIVEPWDKTSIADAYAKQRDDWDRYELSPGKGVLVSAQEHLHLPAMVGGAIGTLSHIARIGLFTHFCSPFVEPGYRGYLALELFNGSSNTICLRPGLPVAKVVLFPVIGEHEEQTSDETLPWYGDSLGDHVDLRSRLADEFSFDGFCSST